MLESDSEVLVRVMVAIEGKLANWSNSSSILKAMAKGVV
jgi:hypothetical protein